MEPTLDQAIRIASSLIDEESDAAAIEKLGDLLRLHGTSADFVLLAANLLVDRGLLNVALQSMIEATQKGVISAPLMTLIGKISLDLEQFDLASKMFSQLTKLEPGNGQHYVYIAHCLSMQDQDEEAIAFLIQIARHFSHLSSFWNVAGDAIQKASRKSLLNGLLSTDIYRQLFDACPDGELVQPHELARLCFERSIEINPEYFQALCNLGKYWDVQDQSILYYQRAISVKPDHYEPHIGLAMSLLANGRVSEAWPHYEYRKDLSRGASKTFAFESEFREFDGAFHNDLTLLIVGEQGLGDEILFLSCLAEVVSIVKKVIVLADQRLHTVLRHSFPSVIVGSYIDHIDGGRRERQIEGVDEGDLSSVDCYCLSGSLLQYFWKSTEDIPDITGGFFEHAGSSSWQSEIDLIPPGPVLGLSWRSGNLKGERGSSYWGFEQAQTVIESVSCSILILQYDITSEELSALEKYSHVHLIGVRDLKQDLDLNFALMQKCTWVAGPPTATQVMSMAIGAKTFILGLGRPWYFLDIKEDYLPYARHVKFIGMSPIRFNTLTMTLQLLNALRKDADILVSEDIKYAVLQGGPAPLGCRIIDLPNHTFADSLLSAMLMYCERSIASFANVPKLPKQEYDVTSKTLALSDASTLRSLRYIIGDNVKPSAVYALREAVKTKSVIFLREPKHNLLIEYSVYLATRKTSAFMSINEFAMAEYNTISFAANVLNDPAVKKNGSLKDIENGTDVEIGAASDAIFEYLQNFDQVRRIEDFEENYEQLVAYMDLPKLLAFPMKFVEPVIADDIEIMLDEVVFKELFKLDRIVYQKCFPS